MQLVGGRSFPLKEKSYFPGCNAVMFLLLGFLAEVADKKELFKLLLDFFGRTFLSFELKAEEWFCNEFLNSFHCFGAGVVFSCNFHSLTFLRKSTKLPSIFPWCFTAKQMLLH